MQTSNFQSLIQAVTSRPFLISTQHTEIQPETEYFIYRILPITQRKIGFYWKTAKTEEKMLKSFITAFTSKYREPDPAAYDHVYGGKQYYWNEKTDEEKEYAYSHHASNMYSKQQLLEQVQSNFGNSAIENSLIRYGFYVTEYGIGTFAYWETEYVIRSIAKMKAFLHLKNIPFANEYSDAKWVYRFKLNIGREAHIKTLNSFCEYATQAPIAAPKNEFQLF